MILIDLFIVFLKIGAFAFGGGYAVLPLIQQYIVNDMAWLSMNEMTNLVALSQITPGPIAINSATFVGTKVAGIAGAIVATLANVTPQFILIMTFSYFIFSGKELKFLDKMLKALKAGIVGLVAVAAIDMFQSSIFIGAIKDFNINWIAFIAFLIGAYLYKVKKLDIIIIFIVGAFLGVFLHIFI